MMLFLLTLIRLFFSEGLIDVHQILIEVFKRAFPDFCRYAVVSLGNAAGDGCKRIAVTTDRNRIADGVLKAGGFIERFKRLLNGILTGLVEQVGINNVKNQA